MQRGVQWWLIAGLLALMIVALVFLPLVLLVRVLVFVGSSGAGNGSSVTGDTGNGSFGGW